jgi:2-dehydropantoate 2-reductase
VKTHATFAALAPLRDVLAPAVPIVSLQNGLDTDVEIERALGPRSALALAPTTEAALLLEPGVVQHTGRGRTMLGWVHGRDGGAWLDTFAALLQAAGLEASVVAPIEPYVWAKAIVNAAVNPLTALARVPNGELLERPELARRLFAIVREGAAVAAAAGIALPFDDPVAYATGIVRASATNRSSMLRDVERGGPTEIEAIAGALVRYARRCGVAVPETERVLDEVRDRMKA